MTIPQSGTDGEGAGAVSSFGSCGSGQQLIRNLRHSADHDHGCQSARATAFDDLSSARNRCRALH